MRALRVARVVALAVMLGSCTTGSAQEQESDAGADAGRTTRSEVAELCLESCFQDVVCGFPLNSGSDPLAGEEGILDCADACTDRIMAEEGRCRTLLVANLSCVLGLSCEEVTVFGSNEYVCTAEHEAALAACMSPSAP